MCVFVCVCISCYIEVREQCYEYSSVQLFAASLLAAELYGRLHLVAAIRRRERFVVAAAAAASVLLVIGVI